MVRVVITGVGLVAPSGLGVREFWRNSAEGRSFVEADPQMQAMGLGSQVLSRAKCFDAKESFRGDPEMLCEDRFVQLGVFAGYQAMADARVDLNSVDRTYAGVIMATAIGGTPSVSAAWERLTAGGAGRFTYRSVGPTLSHATSSHYPGIVLMRRFSFGGPCLALSTGCTAGIDALGLAADCIRSGDAKFLLAGASEAPLAPISYATLDTIGALSRYSGDPRAASRPFDARRAGFVLAEGSVVLAVEELECAVARGAMIYAEVLSFASGNNAFHMSDLRSNGVDMARVIKEALSAADLQPVQIDYINAHGSSTPQNDIFETNAYKLALGEAAYRIPVSSTKSTIGHSLSSASLFGVVAALGAIQTSTIPPTANYEQADPLCDLDYVPRARKATVRAALVTASGFGGIHSVAALRSWTPEPTAPMPRTVCSQWVPPPSIVTGSQRRVVVTGIGVVNPAGIGAKPFWDAILRGRPVLSPITRFDTCQFPVRVAGEITNFRVSDFVPRRLAIKTDRFTHFALAASGMALEDGKLDLDREDLKRIGIWFGNDTGGWDLAERGFRELYGLGPAMVNPWSATAWFATAPQGFVSIRYGIQGCSKSFVCDRATGAVAIYFALGAIRLGRVDVALAGGTEAPLTALGLTAYHETGELSTVADPAVAYRPFDRMRAGSVLGEGSTVLLLEERERALSRGAHIYGEIRGAAIATDVEPDRSDALDRVLTAAIHHSGLGWSDIDLVLAEGCGTVRGDRVEAQAFRRRLAPLTPVSAPKSVFGHLLGASGATDLVCGLFAARDGMLPPTAGLEEPEEDLVFVTTARPHPVKNFLVTARGREGVNVAIVVGARHSTDQKEVV